MKRPHFYKLVIVGLFAVAMGELELRVNGIGFSAPSNWAWETTSLTAKNERVSAEPEVIYGRKSFSLTQETRHAWIELTGSDDLILFFNGTRVGNSDLDGVASPRMVVDVSKLARVGKNTIGVIARQKVHDRVPRFAARFCCQPVNPVAEQIEFGSESQGWKVATRLERQDVEWNSVEFDDDHWQHPIELQAEEFSGPSRVFDRLHKIAPAKNWVGTKFSGVVAFGSDFHAEGQNGCIRICTRASYRIAVNGRMVDETKSLENSLVASDWSYHCIDLSPYICPGRNQIRLLLSAHESISSRFSVDLISIPRKGELKVQSSEASSWFCSSNSANWLQGELSGSDWIPCDVLGENTFAFQPGGASKRLVDSLKSTELDRSLFQRRICLYSLIFLVSFAACEWVRKWLKGSGAIHWEIVYLPLGVVAAIVFAGFLLCFDPRISWLSHLESSWRNGLLLIIAGFWLFLFVSAWSSRRVKRNDRSSDFDGPLDVQENSLDPRLPAVLSSELEESIWKRNHAGSLIGCWALVAGVTMLGCWLRIQQVTQEPFHHDEVIAYLYSLGIFERGLPSALIHPQIPMEYCETSELLHYFTALGLCFTNDPLIGIRGQAVVWGTATIPLIFFVGKNWFDSASGILASTVFAVAPNCVAMGCFGRYFSMLCFLALWVTFLFEKTIAGTERVHGKSLVATVVLFLVMYLTWQASALLAVGLVAAMVLVRGRSLLPIFLDWRVLYGAIFVGGSILLHLARRMNCQSVFVTIGEGISNMELSPMWRSPFFKPFFFVSESCWMADTLVPMCGLALGLLICLFDRRCRNLRYVFAVPLAACLAMGLILPIMAPRYAYHFVPLVLLGNSAVLMYIIRHGIANLEVALLPRFVSCIAWLTAALFVAIWLGFASGRVVELVEMNDWHNQSYRVGQKLFADWGPPIDLLESRLQPGDVVISDLPHITDLLMNLAGAHDESGKEWRSDYWLQSVVILLATMTDSDFTVRSRMSGNLLLHDRQALQEVLDRHERVWYLGAHFFYNPANDLAVKDLLRQQMDVQWQGTRTTLMLHDRRHRTAAHRRRFMKKSEAANALPWLE